MIVLISSCYRRIIFVRQNNIESCLLKSKGQTANARKKVNNLWFHALALLNPFFCHFVIFFI